MIYLGTSYGGWHVEETLLAKDPVIFSAGLGTDISFDLELISRYDVIVHGFDPTPRSKFWLYQQILPKKFIFHDYGISNIDGDVSFYPPEKKNHVSFSETRKSNDEPVVRLPVKRIATIMDELFTDHIDILKMDIEGSEYAVIDDMFDSKIFPKQISVEFHKGNDINAYVNKLGRKYNIANIKDWDFTFILILK